MKRSRSSTWLVRAIPALALTAPLVLLALIYLLGIAPKEAAERTATAQAGALRERLSGLQAFVRKTPVIEAVAQREFEARMPGEDRAAEFAKAIRAVLDSPGVGGAANITVSTGEQVQVTGTAGGDIDARFALFRAPMAYIPMTVSFDASYAHIGRFLWNLRALPTLFELRTLDIISGGPGGPAAAPPSSLMRAKVELFVFHSPGVVTPSFAAPDMPAVADITSPPEWTRDPFGRGRAPAPTALAAPMVKQPPADPVVDAILYSSQNRSALVDGRVVRPGDRVGAGRILAIEDDAVVLAPDNGVPRRLTLAQPRAGAAKR